MENNEERASKREIYIFYPENHTAEELCRLANEHEGPWAQTLKKNPGVVRPDIPNEALKEYFKKQQEANAANSSQAC